MKKNSFLILATLFVFALKAQVGIGTNLPHPSAALEISDTSKGLLMPRMKMANRNAIGSPAPGLMVYQTDSSKGFWFFDGGSWKNMASGNGEMAGVATSNDGGMMVVYSQYNAYAFTRNGAGVPGWYPIAVSGGVVKKAVVTDSSLVVYSDYNAYGFARNAAGVPTWYPVSLSGTSVGTAISNDMIAVYAQYAAYVFTRNAADVPTWYNTAISSGTAVAAVGANGSKKDAALVICSHYDAYGFARNALGVPTWYPKPISSIYTGAGRSGNLITVFSQYDAYAFTRNPAGVPTWYSQALSGGPAVGVAPAN